MADAIISVPMIDKSFVSAEAALADMPDGATVMIGGFGGAGMPVALIDALIAQGARELTIVNNNAGNADTGLAALIGAKRVRKILCSFPRQADSWQARRSAPWCRCVRWWSSALSIPRRS